MATPASVLLKHEVPSEENAHVALCNRQATSFFEKYERYDLQEMLAYSSSHWLLSNEDFRLPTDPPCGLISNISAMSTDSCMIFLPEDPKIQHDFDYRDFHQIVRELTIGIYVLHQTPTISLEHNFEKSTTCQLPPAYLDTKVGQIMLNVDYMMKALWHGAYFPKEKRTKFTERWRSNLDVNANGFHETKKPLLIEFTTAGLMDITKDPDYAGIYDDMPLEQAGDAEMAEERRFLMSHIDQISMQMTFVQKSVQCTNDMYIVDADWMISSIVQLLDDRIDHMGFERIKTRLDLHRTVIEKYLPNKEEIRRQLQLLRFISYMTAFLIGMKKKMKIPNIARMLSPATSDECRTEREFPPLILGPDFKCKNFNFGDQYFHLHGGIVFDLETPPLVDVPSEFKQKYEKMKTEATEHLTKLLNCDPKSAIPDQYKIPVSELNGKRYMTIMIDFETFYGQQPHKPLWVKSFVEEISRLKPKKLPINDINLHEQFKKYFGHKKANTLKELAADRTPVNGLKAAAQRGLVAIFQTLCRKMPSSRLAKQDKHGLSLLHYAAMNNRPQIIAMLLLQSMDVNVRRNNIMSTGPTALHVAARCGALDSVACLLANFANILATDQDGWAPVHHAAFFDHQAVVRLMVLKNDALLELSTKNDLKSTCILLASSSGGLSAVKCLIELGADITKCDGDGNNMVNLAALRFHTNILEYLIDWGNPDIPVWKILVKMLRDEQISKKDSAVKCLEALSSAEPEHWKAILEADGVAALVELLSLDNEEIQSVAASVLCNISENDDIRVALVRCNAGPILIQLLSSPIDDIQSRAAIILSDFACVHGNQELITEHGGIPPLVNLLDSELEDVLVNSVNAIRVLCIGNRRNQEVVAECGGIVPLVEFLTVNSDILQAATAAALAAISAGNKENQDAIIAEDSAKPLVELIKSSRNVTVQVKAASALEALAENNPESQKVFHQLDAHKALLRLLKNINVEVREQGACAIWALAGNTKTQQTNIAERVGIQYIFQMLLEPTEKLLYVGCMLAIALGRENIENQNNLAKADAFQQLVRLLRSSKTSDKVLLMVIKVLGTLCVGVANVNNKLTQKKIAEEGAIPILVQLLLCPPSEEIQVEVAMTLANVVLSNPENQEKLHEEQGFNFDILLDLLKSRSEEIRIRAGMALTAFAFNNTPQQFAIREAGGISFSVFEPFLNKDDEFYQCSAAFQIVVLARVIVDQDQVMLTAKGVTLLVNKLKSADDNVVVSAASLLSSLAHTRAGIPDAMITSGAIDLLVDKLNSPNVLVRTSVAVALGYLTFNKTAARILFSDCRNMPGLYKQLMANIGPNPKISKDFVADFRRAKIIGLPSQCLEVNGGYPVSLPGHHRPVTSQGGTHEKTQLFDRAKSAPSYGRKEKEKVPVPDIVLENTEKLPQSRAGTSTRKVTGLIKVTGDSSFKSQIGSWKSLKG